MEFEWITVSKSEGIATVTLNRPEKLNALFLKTEDELCQALDDINVDEEIRAVILTGAGRAFCVGADAEESSHQDLSETWHSTRPRPRYFYDVAQRLRFLNQPVVAAVHGYCVGGGWTLAMACDITIGAEDTIIFYPETDFGYPSPMHTGFMMHYAPLGWVKRILYCGTRIHARTAERLGLLTEVVPREQLAAAAWEMATEIAARPARGMRMQKEMINRIWMGGWETALYSGIHTSVAAHSDPGWRDRMAEYRKGKVASPYSER